MKTSLHALFAALAVSSAALAQQPAPDTRPAPPAAAQAPAARTISIDFRGPLRDALKRIAASGGINVVATGGLDTPVEVHLNGVTAEQALRTVARAYELRLDEEGGIFTMRPLTDAEKAARGEVAQRAPAAQAPEAPEAAEAPEPEAADVPAVPPLPPGASARERAEAARQQARDMRNAEEKVRRAAEKYRHKANGSNDLVARGHSIEVAENQTVGDAVVYGGTLTVKGQVEGDAVAFGGNLDVYGHVEGDAHAFGGNVVLHKGATVEGDASSFGGKVVREEGATVEGSTESFGGVNLGKGIASAIRGAREAERNRDREDEGEVVVHQHSPSFSLAGFLVFFALMFGLGFVLNLAAPERMRAITQDVRREPLKAGVVGVVGFFVFVGLLAVTGLLSVVLIGLPFLFGLILVTGLAWGAGVTAVASEVGTRLPVLRGRKTQAVVLALGLAVILLLAMIPYLRWIGIPLFIAISAVGFGAVIRTRFGQPTRGMPQPIPPMPPMPPMPPDAEPGPA